MLCHEVRVNVQSHVDRGDDSYMFVRLRGVLQMEVLSVSYELYYIVPCMQATPKSFADFSSTRFWIMFHSVVCLQPSSLWLRKVPFQVWNMIEAILHFFAACFYSTWYNSYSNNIESKKTIKQTKIQDCLAWIIGLNICSFQEMKTKCSRAQRNCNKTFWSKSGYHEVIRIKHLLIN